MLRKGINLARQRKEVSSDTNEEKARQYIARQRQFEELAVVYQSEHEHGKAETEIVRVQGQMQEAIAIPCRKEHTKRQLDGW